MKIIKLNTTDSTQTEIEKYLPCDEDLTVLAYEQTGGKGTKNRSFVAKKGGVYATFLLHNSGIEIKDAHKIIKRISLAVVKTLRDLAVPAMIKWPNDIYANGKKICGILINNHAIGGFIDYTVVGIGINVYNEISDEIKGIATSVKEITGKKFSVDAVFNSLVENLYLTYPDNLYEEYSLVLNKEITVIRGEKTFRAVAKKILPDGRLQIDNGEILAAEEISVRIIN